MPRGSSTVNTTQPARASTDGVRALYLTPPKKKKKKRRAVITAIVVNYVTNILPGCQPFSWLGKNSESSESSD